MRNKPNNLKYTDLCIYIDKTIYTRDEDNNPTGLRELSSEEIEKVYNYLFNIIYALAVKKRLLTHKADYDDFCIEVAGQLFMRLTRKNQDYSGRSSSNKAIKSILNYIKGCLPFVAITWRTKNYANILNAEYDSQEAVDSIRDFSYDQASDQFNEKRQAAYTEMFSDLSTYVNKILEKSIFKNNKKTKYQLEMSEYLTLLNCLTLENKYKNSKDNKQYNRILNQLKNKKYYVVNFCDDVLINDDLIDLQIRKTFFLLEDEKNAIDRDLTPSDKELDNILSTNYTTYGTNQRGDN